MVQANSENMQDYIGRVLRTAIDTGVPDVQQREVLFSGLHPEIQQHVLRSNHTTVDAIRQAAMLAEQSTAAGSVDEVGVAIRRLEEQIQWMTLSNLTDSHRAVSPAFHESSELS
jgi:bacterioferritin (cytochrome b1)